MSLFLIRHGQSIANSATHPDKRILVDTADGSSLTQLGEIQAQKLGRALFNFMDGNANPPIVLTSPLLRARRTAQIILDYLPGAQMVMDPALVEIDVPNGDVCGAVESARNNLEMTLSYMRENFREPVVCVAHEWILQLVIQDLLDCQKCDVWFRLANGSITHFIQDRCVRSDGKFLDGLSLASLSDVTHLSHEQVSF